MEAKLERSIPITAVEREVLEARNQTLCDELNAAKLRATVAEIENGELDTALAKELQRSETAARLLHKQVMMSSSDKTAVMLAVAAFDKLEAQHNRLLGICQDVANAYGNNGVDFHRAVARLRQCLEGL
jgi:hypothetical protein